MIYFVSFFIIGILIQIGMTTKSKIISRILLVLAVLIPATLAGARDYTVGTDVSVYGLNLFNAAKGSPNVVSFISAHQANIESGYLLITYVGSVLFEDAHGFLFLLALLNYSLLIKAIYDYREEIVPGIAWLAYAFLYFGDSLNIMRQSVAIAIVLVGFRFIRERKLIPYAICVLIATLFHQTAILAIAFYFIYMILQTKNRWFHYVWIIGASFAVIFAYNWIIQFLVRFGILGDKYLRYISEGSFHILFGAVIMRVIPLLILVFFWKNFKKNKDADFLMIMVLLDIVLYNAASFSSTLYRVGAYMGYFRMLAYGAMCKQITIKSNKTIIYTLLIAFFVLIFIYEVVINNGNELYPYTSAILGIR